MIHQELLQEHELHQLFLQHVLTHAPEVATRLHLRSAPAGQAIAALLRAPERFVEHAPLGVFGVQESDYPALLAAALSAVQTLGKDLPLEEVLAAERVLHESARQLKARPAPELSDAHVVQVERRSRRITIVRIQVHAPTSYRAGQHLWLGPSLTPGRWMRVYPSIPANEQGQLEIHCFDSSADSSVALREGDTCRVSQGLGTPIELDDRDLLLISHGTALAPMRALMLDLLNQSADPPRIHMFLSSEYPGEQYELATMWQIAATAPWLAITPVVQHPQDAWWVGATEHSKPPRGLHLPQVGQVGQVVASYGRWLDRHIIIAGTTEEIRATQEALAKGGIQHSTVLDTSPRRFWED
ncbi:oxidoreductase [Corynebacterium sp. 153RC1]|uniref:oxidoreductase n=1 Tax=unclassified Corynebacterium TaxID=2624378 RepID=UPI00211CD2E1|nr:MULTISPECIES: oxidoreductase [unclassified Corynebacterium]MCQ9371147.1 oxidoreductase [Corynebacterium sp. 35RC1]MCQ9352552.1 oxidoreductase [Corynebacterium sp. 209RC1]MCQ9354736.1 oxidoreductase [Corynebacterium sp. 1222RC1]MCQ9356847.1 oxidoreductase [Corynebacterium sp. 122RC1]MCQ9358949.1 oxidoreductase [Corynebacterium sp. 142RC1]